MAGRAQRPSVGLILAVALAALTGPLYAAHARASSQPNAALAESLFREAKQLAQEGDYAEACPKFAESQRLDPQLGTLLHLATCHEQEGKTASAWAGYSQAADWAARDGDTKREGLARRRAAALEPALSHLVVEVEELRDGLSITLDGRDLGTASLATPLPVDPGEHTLAATAPGAERWSREIVVPPGSELTTVRIPRLTDDTEQAPEDAPAAPTGGRAQRIAGWTLGGIGLGALVVMAIFGVKAADEASEADSFCDGSYCQPEGLAMHDDARSSATISTVAFVVGLASIGAGLTLVLTAPTDGAESTAWVGPSWTPGGAQLSGGLRW